jgi:ADP-ribosylglycohydrolase
MIKFTREYLRDRIYACWLGKNIGGTMGTPFEGKREINDIQGFTSEPGKPLPNDDLDLQLVWLRAVDELGPDAIDSKILGEYWISYIGPSWNEYGVCKANMRDGVLPPLSGELHNEEWKHSNGAWIRTEIWACLFPANPEKAIRCAFEDASVDHGFGEGTYAAIFVAAMESAAFVIHDIRALLDIGLSKIPEDCRVARSVRLVIDAYDRGIDWREARNIVVEDSADLGWFQAPANIAFTVIGLLYGEGDFKKSMILAINCGDDTDCTGATLGALMGIIHGTSIIPPDWQRYIGDDIITISIIRGFGLFPRTCQELTDCVMNLLPVTTRTDNMTLMQKGERRFSIDAKENDFGGVTAADFMGRAFVERMFNRSRYSFTAENVFAQAIVEFNREPVIAAGGILSGRVSVRLVRMCEQKRFSLRWYLPEGWTVTGGMSLHVNEMHSPHREHATAAFTLTAGDSVAGNNRLILEIACAGRPTPLLVPITIIG